MQYSIQPVQVKRLKELKNKLIKNKITYPLIIKPCNGYGLEGVFRANTKDQLYITVSKLKLTVEGDVLINTFIKGPEVNYNFILLYREVLFFKVIDRFLYIVENDRFNGRDFLKIDQIWPSNHLTAEKELLRYKLYEILVRLGL